LYQASWRLLARFVRKKDCVAIRRFVALNNNVRQYFYTILQFTTMVINTHICNRGNGTVFFLGSVEFVKNND